jgi:hypothetical protein
LDPAGDPTLHTRFQLTRTLVDTEVPQTQRLRVQVGWTDRQGRAQHVALNTLINGNEPAYSGALHVVRQGQPPLGAQGRSARIPLRAHNLGNGNSVFKPVSTEAVVYVFDNATGRIISRCTGVMASNVSERDLTQCDTQTRLLLSGVVRFSSASAAVTNGRDALLSTELLLSLTESGEAPPSCAVEPLQTAEGDRYLAYHCAVAPNAAGQWSGRVDLRPVGWTLGTGSADWRVCRYSSDLDGSGAIDANIEHPPSYNAVNAALPHQNFLVIHATQTCPSGTAQHQS